MKIKTNQKIKGLNLENSKMFFDKLREAVNYLDANFGLSEKEEKALKDSFEIMKGSKNTPDEDDMVYQLARAYGIVEQEDLTQLMRKVSQQKQS